MVCSHVMIPLLFVAVLIKKKQINISINLKSLALTSSFFSIIAAVAYLDVAKIIPVAKFLPLQQVSLVIITVLTGIIFFKEKGVLTGKRLVGMTLGFLGIVMLITS